MVRDRTVNLVKQTKRLNYLGSVMSAKGGCEQDVKKRIKATPLAFTCQNYWLGKPKYGGAKGGKK